MAARYPKVAYPKGMDETNLTCGKVPADWRPGDCDPELTEVVRRAFGTFEELENALAWRSERKPVTAKGE